ncbi:MAG TPA: hypothetical protein VFA56_08240 [Gaiellaceae bacterium]|nr:hypothetical protein [Gaiellaceae bacterium]
MRIRVFGIGGAAALAALSLAAGSAAGARPSPPPASLVWAPTVELSYTETLRDAAGRVVSQTHREGIPAGTLLGSAGVAASTAASDVGHATALDAGTVPAAVTPTRRLQACCSSSGSDTVDFTVTQRTNFGLTVAWRYHQVDHWCWTYPRITCLSIGAGFYDVDGTSSSVNYGDSGYGWYYTWAGSATGGHFAHRSGSVSNCIFKVGCLGTSYPYVDMWLNGNGAWTASGSTN